MKKIISILIIICSTILLLGCAKCIETEISEVQVVIKSEYYKPTSIVPTYNPALKTTTLKSMPAKYRIIVEYNSIEYVFTDRNTYYKCKDNVRETMIGVLKTRKYDDGTVKYEIIEVK